MSLSIVQSAGAYASSALGVGVAPASSITAGNGIIVGFRADNIGSGTPDDHTCADNIDASNVYGKDVTLQYNPENRCTMFACDKVLVGGSGTITGTSTGPGAGRRAIAYAEVGCTNGEGITLDQTTSASDGGSPTSGSAGNLSTTVANEVMAAMFGDFYDASTYTAGSGWTKQFDSGASAGRSMFETRIVSSTGTYAADASFSNAVGYTAVAASYYETAASGGLSIAPSGIASAEAFGSAAISVGAVSLTPSGIASLEAFGSATISTSYSLQPSGIASLEAFGTQQVNVGAVSIVPAGIASLEAFGGHTLSPGAVSIAPSGISSAEAFGSDAVTVGAISLQPSGIASAEAFGGHTLSPGAVTITPSGIASEEAFGSDVVSTGGSLIVATGIVSLEAFGAPTLSPGAVTIAPSGVATEEAFGSQVLSTGAVEILPAGIASAEVFGGSTVVAGAVTIAPTGITSLETFGGHIITGGATTSGGGGVPFYSFGWI